MARIVIGMFDSRGDAERTVAQLLQQLGVKPEQVELHAREEGGIAEGPRTTALDRLALPQDDLALCREAIRRGGIIVAAWVDDTGTEPAMDAFEANGAVDLEAREAEWRNSGWSGYTGHDEDIGFATYGQDAVIGRIPQRPHEEGPSGALGRLEVAVGEETARARRDRIRARARSFIPAGS